ncbi:MAG: hypothetical protein JO090_15475 [Rhizobacter sp.]|nr:hypothetical protein [Rhizobacter sp.]
MRAGSRTSTVATSGTGSAGTIAAIRAIRSVATAATAARRSASPGLRKWKPCSATYARIDTGLPKFTQA